MPLTKLTTKGQVVIPKDVRAELGWKPGTTLVVVRGDNGITLRPRGTKREFEAWLRDTMGSLKHGDPVGDLERDHRAEMARDEARHAADIAHLRPTKRHARRRS